MRWHLAAGFLWATIAQNAIAADVQCDKEILAYQSNSSDALVYSKLMSCLRLHPPQQMTTTNAIPNPCITETLAYQSDSSDPLVYANLLSCLRSHSFQDQADLWGLKPYKPMVQIPRTYEPPPETYSQPGPGSLWDKFLSPYQGTYRGMVTKKE
jgi:hypothetical protein